MILFLLFVILSAALILSFSILTLIFKIVAWIIAGIVGFILLGLIL